MLLISKAAGKKPYIIIPLKTKLKEIEGKDKKRTEYTTKELSVVGSNYMLVITDLTGFRNRKTGKTTVTNLQGSLFLK
jgi:hypothetical protein